MEYEKPTSLAGAISLLKQGGAGARAMGGGTDLVVQIREGRRTVDLLVDIKAVPEATAVQWSSAGLHLGAAVPCYRIYQDGTIASHYPGLIDSASLIGGTQIQSRAGLGGNLCNASPAADSIPTLIALGATCNIVGPNGNRTLPVEQFCTGPGQNALQPGELLVSFDFPTPAAHSGAFFLRFIPRNEMDIAVVNAAAAITLDADQRHIAGARLAVGAVAPTPLLIGGVAEALAGQPVDAPDLEPAMALARAAAKPITDMRGSAKQRVHLSGVLAKRALEGALARARSAA
ncbi:MAG TPA: xanthine dehydrogenase family protein subunit M [Chloroflexota bacterium]|nr:xanthine dehydrogenase family protein subunit M [Chloroflexota bacterium]